MSNLLNVHLTDSNLDASERVNADMHHIDRDPETQHRILAVAEQLFLAKGFKGVSMKDIAEEVQVTPAALYYYFPQGKQEIFISMFNQLIDNWSEQALASISTIEGIRPKLIYMAETFFTRRFSNSMSLMRDVREFLHENKQNKQILLERHLQRREHLIALFQQGIDNGELANTASAAIYASLYEGMISGMHPRQGKQLCTTETDTSVDVSGIAETIVGCLLDGIALKK
jgi:AcrR family transcriptional regulator